MDACEGQRSEKPFEYNCKGGNHERGNNMTVHCKYVVTHASLQRDHRDYVHSCVPELQGDHTQVRFHLVKRLARHRTCHLVSYLYIRIKYKLSQLKVNCFSKSAQQRNEKGPSYSQGKQEIKRTHYAQVLQHMSKAFPSHSSLDSLIH